MAAGSQASGAAVDSGRMSVAVDLMDSDGAASVGQLASALSQLRNEVSDTALRASDRAADAIRYVSIALVVPVAPSAWVAFQLIKGLRELRSLNRRMVDAATEVSASAAQLSAASEELAATSVEGAAAFSEAHSWTLPSSSPKTIAAFFACSSSSVNEEARPLRTSGPFAIAWAARKPPATCETLERAP